MSTDEDLELRDIVAHTLEVKGVLNKIRAELRANVFLALEEQDAVTETNISNKHLANFLETKEGHQVFCLVREFLQFFHLDFTLAVLEPESNCGNRKMPSSREDLKNEFNLLKCDSSQPLLIEFLNKHMNGGSPPSSASPSKKNSSKIPRLVKSPTNLSKHEDDLQHADKPTGISQEHDNDDDDELLKELGISPVSFNGMKKHPKRANWLDDSNPPNVSPEHSPKKVSSPDLGSLKGAPPLPGISTSPLPASSTSARIGNPASPKWDEIIRMEEKLSSLGFELPLEEDSQDEGTEKATKGVRYSYEDDFLSLGQSEEEEEEGGKLSITEEIEGELSLGSFAGSKGEDVLCTTDETVSQINPISFDFGEDAVVKGLD